MPSSVLLPALLATGFALQPPGRFHGNEPVARDGERWLALRVDARGSALVETTLHVHAVEDVVLDAPGERSGREVGSSLDEAGIVTYVRGADLHAGPLDRAEVAVGAVVAAPMPARVIAWRTQQYRLETRCDAAPFQHIDAQAQYRCRLVLGDGRREQALLETIAYRDFEAALSTEATAEVLFAGDLDRDGRLDLIVDLTDHYNVSRPTLLLSSQAASGEIVGVAAAFESVGC
jgi:hypothetical protein